MKEGGNLKILHLVTARGGSKGIPHKNLQMVGELPLLAYKIRSAQKSALKGPVVVSTDCGEIAAVARSFGAEVPFMRPEYLATDEADSLDVVRHALCWLKENTGEVFDCVSLLEPSSPFATYADLNGAMALLAQGQADSVLGVVNVKVNPVFVKPLDAEGRLSRFYESMKPLKRVRRQDFEPSYTFNGAVYLFRRDYFEKTGMIVSENSLPYIMDDCSSLEIDTPFELDLARFLAETGRVDLSYWR